jgi:guanine deaminase
MDHQESLKEEQEQFMRRAIELSYFGFQHNHGNPFGSVVVRNESIIGEGWNRVKQLNDPSAHAELMAIRDACAKLGMPTLTGCTIYASGQPCPMCLSLIYLVGIEKVYYCIPGERTASMDPRLSVAHIYHAIAMPQHERPVRELQVMPDEIEKAIARYQEIRKSS